MRIYDQSSADEPQTPARVKRPKGAACLEANDAPVNLTFRGTVWAPGHWPAAPAAQRRREFKARESSLWVLAGTGALIDNQERKLPKRDICITIFVLSVRQNGWFLGLPAGSRASPGI